MHGRPRVKDVGPQNPEKVKAAEKKAELFGELCRRVLEARQQRLFTVENLNMSSKLLQMNPEMYTVWNYRREYLESIIEKGGDEAVAAVKEELVVTERALFKNPKSYATFHHRRWVVSSGFCSLEHELDLVEKLLDADDRNFHGWGYRRCISKHMGLPVSRELEYSRKKIEQNFSNYSAWHHRSTLLPLQGKEQDEIEKSVGNLSSKAVHDIPLDTLEEEFQFVRQACYTDPLDQSGWFYHRWLLGCLGQHVRECIASQEEEKKTRVLNMLCNELTMCGEIHELEPRAKWPVLTAIQIEKAILHTSKEEEIEHRGIGKDVSWLVDVDPMRRNFYTDVAEMKADPWSIHA
ncbi:hypothetical protein M9435_000461 [Picochlorum sp. BPE23]|nr:hypothetical protein M9435_000461 [Picochlorum sp. BPE23]